MWIVESLVNGPETIDLLEIVEVHPENTVIAVTVKTNLVSKLVGPEWGRVTPVTIPLTTTPWVSELDEANCVSINVEHLSC